METLDEIGFSTRTASKLADVSYRQVDYWCRTGAIPTQQNAPGSGNHRTWTADEIWIVRVLGVLSSFGATNAVWRSVAGYLGAVPAEHLPPAIWITADGRVWSTPRSGWYLDLAGIRADLGVDISLHLSE